MYSIFSGVFGLPYRLASLLIFTTRDLSRTMVRRVWWFLLPADHGIGGLICPCLVAWSPVGYSVVGYSGQTWTEYPLHIISYIIR